MAERFVTAEGIRSAFSSAMSKMYRAEVPLYGELIDIVASVNERILSADGALRERLERDGELGRLDGERHGAIRVGTASELSMLRRIFALMGMRPVGYYDLAVAGVPVHSTAFRSVEPTSLASSPFRVFTSLLRLELIKDDVLRAHAETILAGRDIVTGAALDLIEKGERDGGLTAPDAVAFVGEVLHIFRWHGDAIVDADSYGRLSDAHRLIADVVSFRGPHINHLTPRTLDIDAAQLEMVRRGIDAKAVIEGPPRRAVPILLRQTSFKALEETIHFVGQGASEAGTHTARFGEIEQRGIALTHKGRELYDALLNEAREEGGPQAGDYQARLETTFERFPDDEATLRQQGLAFFRYRATATGLAAARRGIVIDEIEAMIAAGWVCAEPITYEDFLPVSAAGIFQSNLGERQQAHYAASKAQAEFEQALGVFILDPFELYATQQTASLASLKVELEQRRPSARRV